jgi:hypothetical protein
MPPNPTAAKTGRRGAKAGGGLVIGIDEAFRHCPEAFIRSGLWNPARHIDRKILPSCPRMLRDHVQGLTEAETDRQTQVMAERGPGQVMLLKRVLTNLRAEFASPMARKDRIESFPMDSNPALVVRWKRMVPIRFLNRTTNLLN